MPRIDEDTIRRVAEATDIVELIGSYFPLKRAGATWRALCPFHNEKTPSFHVNPTRQSYKCFGCGAGGTVFRFLMDYEHISFVDAVRRLASRAGIPVVEETGTGQDDRANEQRKRLLAIHAEAAAWFHQQLLTAPSAAPARDYLKSRGLNRETAVAWQLGFAPDSWDALPDFLAGKGFRAPDIALSGLVSQREDRDGRAGSTYARFRGRLMFPIRNDYGEVVAFSGRILEADPKAAKYVNSPETPIFTKGRVLFGLDKTKRALIAAKEAIVCEGQIDLISSFEAGVTNVIAPQGTAFTTEQARILARFVESVILCFDSDRAGQEATNRSVPALVECGLAVRVARLPEGHDPDSLIRQEGAGAFRERVAAARDFFEYAVDRTMESGAASDPGKLATATRKLGTFVALVKDPVQRELVTARISARLGIPPRTLADQLRQAKQPRPDSPAEPAGAAPQVVSLSAGVELLCRLALYDPASRKWLAAQDPNPAIGAGGDVLARILATQEPLDSPASQATFAASLPAPMERALASLDPENLPDNPLDACRSAWNGLLAARLRSDQESLKARLREPGLSSDQAIELQKQILDLSHRLNDLIRPSA